MNTGKIRRHLSFLCATLVLAASTATATVASPGEKSFTWTTESAEAKALVTQIVRSIETFQAGPQTLALAQKIVELDPNFAFGHYLVATFSPTPEEQQKNGAKAIELGAKASEGERLYMQAVLDVRAQKMDAAIPVLEKLSKDYPGERMVFMMLGQAQMNRGNLKASRAAFEKAIKLDPSTPRAHSFLGNILILSEDYAEARAVYAKAMESSPKTAVPFGPGFGTAFSYIYEGKPDRAIEAVRALQARYVELGNNTRDTGFPDVFFYNAIARIYLEFGKPELALKEYEKGYETVKVSNVQAMNEEQRLTWLGRLHHGKGRTLAKMGRFDEAWKEAETIKKMIEDGGEAGKQYWPAYHYLAGYIMLEKGDTAKAIEHLKESNPTDEFQLLLLGRAYEKAGDKANAMSTYKKVTESSQVNIERALAYPEAKKKLRG